MVFIPRIDADRVVINTDDLSLDFFLEQEALATEDALSVAIMAAEDEDRADVDAVKVHISGTRVWLTSDGAGDQTAEDGALDSAIEIFADYVTETFGAAALDAALARSTEPRS